MGLTIVIISIILIALAGIGLAIKYYNEKRAPYSKRLSKDSQSGKKKSESLSYCDTSEDESISK